MESDELEWQIWYKRFSVIRDSDILKCGIIAGKSKRLLDKWIHMKYYKKSNDDDGSKEQLFRDKWECPNKRKLFYASTGRFSLIDKPVCYLANDNFTPTIETTPSFKNKKKLTFKKNIKPWLSGKDNPTPNKMGYPKMRICIKPGANILDLKGDPTTCRFYHLFNNYNLSISAEKFYKEIVNKKNPDSYETTRALAEFTHDKGFNGILYETTHPITDRVGNKDILVIFDSKVIEEKKY